MLVPPNIHKYRDSSDCINRQTKSPTQLLTNTIKNNHPAVLEELQRVEMDMELAQRYPQNMEEILQKRMEYHELNICDNHLLECSFVRNALNAHMIRML